MRADNSTNYTSTSFLPPSDYINRRPIGVNALWYAPVVGSGNAGSVGAYLDHLPAPTEYSGLYNAHNNLDVLNDGSATRLAPALTELTGENHASAVWVAPSNADHAARTFAVMPAVHSMIRDQCFHRGAVMSYAPAPAAPEERRGPSGR